MASFAKHIGSLITKEGGYVLTDNPNDRGGQTYAGISRKWNPDWPGWAVIDRGGVPAKELVDGFYRVRYWNAICGDKLKSDDVAEILLSSAVLSGAGTAVWLAQMAVGAKPDRRMGPKTLKAVNEASPELFEAMFLLMRINRFREICNRDRSQDANLLGWLNRVYAELES